MSGCRPHCAACGRHFTSEGGFDAHRVGDHSKPNGHPEGRRCLDPASAPRLVAYEGRCEVYRESLAETIYGLKRDQTRARSHFGDGAPQEAPATRKAGHVAG